jgi:hypothetical protein
MLLAKHTWTEYEVEQAIGNLLRSGVFLAAVVVLLGRALYPFRHGAALPLLREAGVVCSFRASLCSRKVVLRFASYTCYPEQHRQESQVTKGEHNATKQGTTVQ